MLEVNALELWMAPLTSLVAGDKEKVGLVRTGGLIFDLMFPVNALELLMAPLIIPLAGDTEKGLVGTGGLIFDLMFPVNALELLMAPLIIPLAGAAMMAPMVDWCGGRPNCSLRDPLRPTLLVSALLRTRAATKAATKRVDAKNLMKADTFVILILNFRILHL
jgi:hypothetical protein